MAIMNFKNSLKFLVLILLAFFVLANPIQITKMVGFAVHAIDTSTYEEELARKEQEKKDKEAALALLK